MAEAAVERDRRVLVQMPGRLEADRIAAVLRSVGLDRVVSGSVAQLCDELPVEVSTRAHRDGAQEDLLDRLTANITLVERPVRIRVLVSVVRAALRARQHQYEPPWPSRPRP